ncbi:Uncharacterised protein [Pseudomonas aeruginosa]|nr:Uncharacterised protein [Pseudomonas aeruginosa]
MTSGQRLSNAGTCSTRVAAETSPAPQRRALSAASSTAPPMPVSPPTTSRWPNSPLCAVRGRAARLGRAFRARRWARGWSPCNTTASLPSSSNTSSPTRAGASPVNSPIFRPMKVTVRSALIASPNTAPVSALKPEGISTASTGRSAALARRMACAKGSRTAPARPVPSNASTTTPSSTAHSLQGSTTTPVASAAARACAASPASRCGAATASTRTRQPARCASAAIR